LYSPLASVRLLVELEHFADHSPVQVAWESLLIQLDLLALQVVRELAQALGWMVE